MELILLIILALGLTATDFMATEHNRNSEYNGLGCLNAVMHRKSKLPMQHRIAIPWIVSKFENQVLVYDLIKMVGNIAGVMSMYAMARMFVPAQAFEASLFLVALIAGTLLFDYPDYGWEIAFVCGTYMLCASGYPQFAAALILPWSLMRESALFGVIIIAMYSPFCVPALFVYWVSRRWLKRIWGNPAHYVKESVGSLFLWKLNWQVFRRQIIGRDGLYWLVVAVLSVCWLCWTGAALLKHNLQPIEFALPAMLMIGAAIAFGRWNELRTFLSAMPPLLMVWYA